MQQFLLATASRGAMRIGAHGGRADITAYETQYLTVMHPRTYSRALLRRDKVDNHQPMGCRSNLQNQCLAAGGAQLPGTALIERRFQRLDIDLRTCTPLSAQI